MENKGTVSKVLNYKQALSLTMIRKFSKLLRIPADSLMKEYRLTFIMSIHNLGRSVFGNSANKGNFVDPGRGPCPAQ